MRGCARAATVIKWLFIGSVFSNRTRFRWLQRFTIRWIETRSLVSFFSRRTTNCNAGTLQFRCTCVRRCGCTSYASEAQSKHACHRTDEWTNEITREQSNRSHEHDIPQNRKYMCIDVKRARSNVRRFCFDFPDGMMIPHDRSRNVDRINIDDYLLSLVWSWILAIFNNIVKSVRWQKLAFQTSAALWKY